MEKEMKQDEFIVEFICSDGITRETQPFNTLIAAEIASCIIPFPCHIKYKLKVDVTEEHIRECEDEDR